MKEQRKQIIDSSIETELAEVKGADSRFVDLGFVRPVQEEVTDSAGAFISAVQTTADILSGSDKAKSNNALAKARATTDARIDHDDYSDVISNMEKTKTLNANQKQTMFVGSFKESVVNLEGKSQSYIDTYIAQRGYFTNTSIAAASLAQRSIVDSNNEDNALTGLNASLSKPTPITNLQKEADDYRTATKDSVTVQQQSANILKASGQRIDNLARSYANDYSVYTTELQTVTNQAIVQRGGERFKLTKEEQTTADRKLSIEMDEVIRSQGKDAWTPELEGKYKGKIERDMRMNIISDTAKASLDAKGMSPSNTVSKLIKDLKGLQKTDKSGRLIDLNTTEAEALRVSISRLEDVVMYTEASQMFDPTVQSLDTFKKKLSANLTGALPSHITAYLDTKADNFLTGSLTGVLSGTALDPKQSLAGINEYMRLNIDREGADKPVKSLVNEWVGKLRDGNSGLTVANFFPYLRETFMSEEAKDSLVWQTMNDNPTFAALNTLYTIDPSLANLYGDELLGMSADDFGKTGSLKLPGQSTGTDQSAQRLAITLSVLEDAVIPPSQLQDNINMVQWLLTRPGVEWQDVKASYEKANKVDMGKPLPGFKLDNFYVPRIFKGIIQQDAQFKNMKEGKADGITSTAILASFESQYMQDLVNSGAMSLYTENYNVGLEGDTRIRKSRNRLDWSNVDVTWTQPKAGVYKMRVTKKGLSGGAFFEAAVSPELISAKVEEAKDRAKIAFRSNAIQEAYESTGLTSQPAEYYYKNPGAEKPWNLLGNSFFDDVFGKTEDTPPTGGYEFKE